MADSVLEPNGGRRTRRRPPHYPDMLQAPLSGAQISLINRAQLEPGASVCPFRDQHRPHFVGENVLIAVTTGMVCPGCDYRQDWAHAVPGLRPAAPRAHTLTIEAVPVPSDVTVTRVRPPLPLEPALEQ